MKHEDTEAQVHIMSLHIKHIFKQKMFDKNLYHDTHVAEKGGNFKNSKCIKNCFQFLLA